MARQPGQVGLTGKIVIEYLSDERWKNLPSRTLSKKIYNENKEAFTNSDTVYSAIRYYRGATGEMLRKNLATKDFIDYNPYNLPQSYSDDFFPFIIEGVKTIGLLSDIHIPYHDLPAIYCALEYFQKVGVDCIMLNGDIIDCYQLSNFEKDPRKRHFAEEIEDCRLFLAALRKEFPSCRIIFKLGNHEERLEKYLMVKAPELLNLNEFELKNLLKLDELKIEPQTCDKQIFKFKSLNIIHGHEIGKSFIPAVNPARGLYLRAKTSTICGHFHRGSEHTEKDLNGKVTKYWSTACLCELNPKWLPINNWSHGAAIIRSDDDDFHVENFSIINGRKV